MTRGFFVCLFVLKRMKAPVSWIKCASLQKLLTGPLNLWISVQPPRMQDEVVSIYRLWQCISVYENRHAIVARTTIMTKNLVDMSKQRRPRNNSRENNEGELTACGCFITTWDHQYTLKGFSSLLERSGAVMDVFQPQRGGSMLTDVDGLPLCFRGPGCLCECWYNTGSNNTRLAPPYVYKYIHKYMHIYCCVHTHTQIDR